MRTTVIFGTLQNNAWLVYIFGIFFPVDGLISLRYYSFYLFTLCLPLTVYKNSHDLTVQLNCIAVQIIRYMNAN